MNEGSKERLVVIGRGVVADQLVQRGVAAGWQVDRVGLFARDNEAGGPALAEAPSEAVKLASIIAIATNAAAHGALGILLAGGIQDDALLVLVPGQTGGALQLARALSKEGRGPIVAETSWAPFVTPEIAVPLATIPSREAPAVAARLAPLFKAQPAPSALWTALHTPDLVLRTIPMIVGVLAKGEERQLGKLLDGPGDGIVVAFERERARVAQALGLDVPSTAAWLSEALSTPRGPLAQSLGPLATLTVPPITDQAWLADLAPFGLAPFCEIADSVNVPTPCAESLIRIAGWMLGNDYRLGGRTALQMGLADVLPPARTSSAHGTAAC